MFLLSLLLASAMHVDTNGEAAHAPDAATLASIARDIESLKVDYPQLEAFSATEHADTDGLRIAYAHRTHRATQPGGWTAGVPNPDDDGIWFHIDFHDPASTLQIHTQPMVGPPQCLGNKQVAFLILEGARTRAVGDAIRRVLQRHGVGECAAA